MTIEIMSERNRRIEGTLLDMGDEAERALQKHGPKNTMDAPDKTDGYRLAILMEEVGEVAKELTYDHAGVTLESTGERPDPWIIRSEVGFTADGKITYTDPDGSHERSIDDMTDEALWILGYRRSTQKERLRKELIQAGAMCATWAAMLS